MTNFELGQVFEGEIDDKPATVVVVRSFGDLAEAAYGPAHWKIIVLHRESMSGWKPIPATARDWYLEGVWADNHPLWSVFIPGFEAAWAFFSYRLPDLRADGGNIRIKAPDDTSKGELEAFDDAGGLGTEPFIGFEMAVERLK